MKDSDGMRWLATIGDSELAMELAQRYAAENGARLRPTDTLLVGVLVRLDRALYDLPLRYGSDGKGPVLDASFVAAFAEVLRIRDEGLCARFRKRVNKRVVCDGCPIKDQLGPDNCKGLPLQAIKSLLRSKNKGPLTTDIMRDMVSTLRLVVSRLLDKYME